ncbi:hypothetical protein nbrc107696_07970 [Gordonia spumicola]|uniref:Glycoside hydrolase family 5 domain-containing protein n=1 Tax=Gordonia spumicola TaxID=589161 RepID=A0A7I9V5P5_9ACTN|nr:beta-galactosidase [Gordonia spumicola]GEE00351.1 hypothetical protein nbrc107696_07970 [Gordonia spumicola]
MSAAVWKVAAGIVTVLVAAVIVTVATTAAARRETTPTPSAAAEQRCTAARSVGFAGGAEMMTKSNAAVEREFAAMAAMGARWVRIGIEWDVVEAERGTLDWRVPDRVITLAKKHGFQVLAVVFGTPEWARLPQEASSDAALPGSAARFGRFVRDAARHEGDRVQAWEIWNEPNLVFRSFPRPDVVRYHRLLIAASRAVKSVSPSTPVITGGLAPTGDDGINYSPSTFVKQLYALGDIDEWDGVGIHPYTFPALPEDTSTSTWNTYLRLDLVFDTMRQAGDGRKQVWITEFGAPTGGDPAKAVTEDDQKTAIMQILSRMAVDPLIGPTIIHSAVDRGGRNPDDIENHFGLMHTDFTPKPAYTAISEFTHC